MRIVLSRKGFDTSAGGVPSPILPDNRIVTLPIPDPLSSIRYQDIRPVNGTGPTAAQLVESLTQKQLKGADRAHLDPDLQRASFPRQPGWRPLFGQAGAAQGHLRNQGVTVGDVFLFFGLFQPVIGSAGRFRFDPTQPRRHLIWGWLQIGAISAVIDCGTTLKRWAGYHPHFQYPALSGNTVYVAPGTLNLPGQPLTAPGGGCWTHARPHRTLTAPEASAPTRWRLPRFFYPSGQKPPLTYHARRSRWRKTGSHTHLQAASRGQEFVLDCDHYPDALPWLTSLFEEA